MASGVFFWAAHVYAYLLSDRIHGHVPTTRADVQRIAFREWPLFQSTFPLAVPLALGWSGLIDGDTALVLATIVGVATLAAWGISFLAPRGLRAHRNHRLSLDQRRRRDADRRSEGGRAMRSLEKEVRA